MRKLLLILFTLLIFPSVALAQENLNDEIGNSKEIIDRPIIRIINSDNFEVERDFYPFEEDSNVNGINIVTADLNGDNFKEIIVAAGAFEKPLVKIFNHLGEFQYEFLAYHVDFDKGLKVTVADLYNDGSPEIITAPNEGGGPHIRIFDNLGFAYFSFFAFDPDSRSGANIAVGDVNNDGQKEIIVGAGYGMEPIVKIFDNYSNFIKEFYAYEDTFIGGVNVLTADLDNNGYESIITAPYTDKEPMVKIFDHKGEYINQFLAYHPGFGGGVNLAKSDVDQDGYIDILTGAGFSGNAHLRIFDKEGVPKINPKLFIFENFKGGISIADGDIDNDGSTEILAATQTISKDGKYQSYKTIEIDLNKQKMYTYFKGLKIHEFIISSGKWKFPTPRGDFKILSKFPSVHMSGYYGEDHPENYDLPNVPHVMPFYKNYAIHGAYWHWNFGWRVSHGCINLRLPDAKTLYEWAKIDTPVIIY